MTPSNPGRCTTRRHNGLMTAARILVIEDSDTIRLAVVTALSAQGFEVSGSADAKISRRDCRPTRPIW